MIKKILKFLYILIIIFLIIFTYLKVITPLYDRYKANKKPVVVDTSGIRATSRNKVTDTTIYDEAEISSNEGNSSTAQKGGLFATISNGVKKTYTSIKNNITSNNDNKNDNNEDLENKEYTTITFDDRILLHEGNINSSSMNLLMDALIDDYSNKSFTKTDVQFNNINGLTATSITFDNPDTYITVLNEVKKSISPDSTYTVSFEYNKFKTIVNKVIISKN